MGLSISDKLKKYITENGGDPSGAQTIAELVDKLPAVGSGGGSGSNVFVFHANAIQDNVSPVFEETLDDLLAAVRADKTVFVMNRNKGSLYSITNLIFDDTSSPPEFEARFDFLDFGYNSLIRNNITIYIDSDTGELASEVVIKPYSLTPAS